MNEAKRNSNDRILRAERAVSGSLDKLENVMEDITQRVEDGSQKIKHVVDLGIRQKNEFLRLKKQAGETLEPIIQRGSEMGRNLYSSARANPRPYAWGAAILVGAFLLMSYSRRARAQARYESDLERWAA